MLIDEAHIIEAEQLLIRGNHFDDERRDYIKNIKSCDLLAVPGSGKTTALQAKLYCLSKLRPNTSTSGILVLSHTNAAVEEIKRKLALSCPSLFEYPNFIGTIQDFVDTFLAIPYYNKSFGQSITRIDGSIYKEEFRKACLNKRIWKDKVWTWYQYNGIDQAVNFGIRMYADGHQVPWNYSTRREFKVAATNAPRTWNGVEDKNRAHILHILCELKHRSYEKGILNYDDCYVLAQMYINTYPRIKTILRNRFKYVFIDETQDLQDYQLEIVDQIFYDDSVCVQRIGDVNQSIYHAGTESTDCTWIPRNVKTFNNSLRLSENVASIVNSFMFRREEGQVVNGLRRVEPEISPYLFIYDYEHRSLLKPKFIELIQRHNLRDIPESKYGFHIIGWNSKWNDDKVHIPNELRLSDIYQDYKSKEISAEIYAESLADSVMQFQYLTDNKQRKLCIDVTLCECLRLCNFLDNKIVRGRSCKRPFTPSSLKDYLTQQHGQLLLPYKLRTLNILRQIATAQYDKVYDNIKELVEWIVGSLGVYKTEEYLQFVGAPYNPIDEPVEEVCVPINIETIHRAKGQTHCGTLYIETMYKGKYESTHLLNRIYKKATKKKGPIYCSNPFYKEVGMPQNNSYAQSAMKMSYVGLSRPTHLMCYAMHKSSFDLYDVDKLQSCGWVIIDLTA